MDNIVKFINNFSDMASFIKVLFDNNPSMVYIKDENLNIVLCNKATLDFYGFDSSYDIIGKKMEDFVENTNFNKRTSDLELLLFENNEKINLEEELYDVCGDQKYFSTNKVVFNDEKTNKKFLLVISNDVTSIKKREKVFRETHDFFASFLDAIPALIFVLNEKAKYVYINRRARDVFEINSQLYKGKNSIELFNDKEMANNFHHDYLESLISGQLTEEEEYLKINGDYSKFATIKMPFSIDDDKYLIVVRFSDMDNKIKEFQDILVTDMEKQVLFSMTTFISGITHEFRTPLQSIKGCLDLLLKYENSNKNEKLLTTASSAVESINAIVNNLFHFGMTKGNYKSGDDIYKTIIQDRKKVNIYSLIEETLDVVKLATLYKEHMNDGYIKIEGRKELECYVSNYILRNILINLVNNSIKAIVVRKKHDNEFIDPCIKIKIIEEKEDISIEVQDNGIGIQSDMASKLFSPFFRVNREIPGVGIGLFISKFWATSAFMNLELKESSYGKTIFSVKLEEYDKELEDASTDNR